MIRVHGRAQGCKQSSHSGQKSEESLANTECQREGKKEGEKKEKDWGGEVAR